MAIYNDIIEIKGGQIPKGTVTVSGAKNSATRLLAAASICDETVTLTGYPTNLVDSKHKERFLNANGVLTHSNGDILEIDPTGYSPTDLDDYFYPIRTTYLLVAGQLKKNGKAYIPYPGGCNIGARKYDVHIAIWEEFGCLVEESENCIIVTAPDTLLASEYEFPISTVGGTENALLMASIASGTSTFANAYITPEIEDLIEFLKRSGVTIEVVGQSFIKVTGCEFLKGHSYHVLPDRIEALTWLVYGAISGGEILIKNIPFNAMEIPLMYLRNAGVDFFQNSDSIFINRSCMVDGHAHSFEVACGTHPGIISDMQPFYVMLGLMSVGKSRIHDYRYPERVTYVEELQKFVNLELDYTKGKITTNGPVTFNSADAIATDLRGTMAAVLAALCAPSGISKITGVSMALRGYNDLVAKLATLNVIVNYKG
ncbi:UDP-N-acetylglucosamine 1-carboxyvinyltransferase [Vibrio gigantis]|uniref:UDP-N-acetylglucosamine 1-carboxyvinyltransferase n=1 Tax=Vibrio gigantis TaxID=296199 RepID=UPI001EFC1C16|nr:UDP-N-acetylglucosamine 1-carboxyvinyltransferase [Vibrio gigantis]ULN64466.1 UDP-N-acetylglucosamine 1-carboxyvinyltransferase [Vibrio gigantis]